MSFASREVLEIENKHAQALFSALDARDIQALKALLEKRSPNEYKAALSARNAFGEDVLMFAARRGFLAGLDALLEQGFIVDSALSTHRDKAGNTALLAGGKAPAEVLEAVIERLLRAAWNIYATNYANRNVFCMVLARYHSARVQTERDACINTMHILADYGALIAQRFDGYLVTLFQDIPALPCFGASFAYKTAKEALPKAYYTREHLDAWVIALQRLRADGLQNTQAEMAEAKLRNLQRVRSLYWQTTTPADGMQFFKAASRTEETLFLQRDHLLAALPDDNALIDRDKCPVPLQRAYEASLSLLTQCHREGPPTQRLEYFFREYASVYYLIGWLVLVGAGAGTAIALRALWGEPANNQNQQKWSIVGLSVGLAAFGFIWLVFKWTYERVLAAQEATLNMRFRVEHTAIYRDVAMLKDGAGQTSTSELDAVLAKLRRIQSRAELESLASTLGHLAQGAKQTLQEPELDSEGLETISLF